jgi:tetratricopeptide (TPR) repeat protein
MIPGWSAIRTFRPAPRNFRLAGHSSTSEYELAGFAESSRIFFETDALCVTIPACQESKLDIQGQMTDAHEVPLEAKIFALLFQGIEAQHRGNLPAANKLIEIALRLADEMPAKGADGFRALGRCSLTLLREKEDRPDDAAKEREEAMALVDRISKADLPFPELMSALLIDLHEYRRAIPFCERAVQQGLEMNDPIGVANLLSREGHCYAYCGLKDQAAIPLRAALKILRNYPQEPSLVQVLIGLGNALRKSSPSEAEELYKEAADIDVARAHLESATAAWVNLGVLYAEQGRNSEALGYYQKALDVREKSPATSPTRVAMLLNNIANCHRRSRDFDEALRLIDRATEMLKSENIPKIASAYGTKGQILQDAGNDAEAVEWLRRSYAERQKQPSPDYELMIENLGYEIASLKRLGRTEDAADAAARMAMAREEMNAFSIANVDVSALTAEPAGAVLIELAFGPRPGGRYGIRDAEAVLEQIFAILSAAKLGESGSRVATPESITLIFYGANAQAMFEAMEQFLSDHLIFAGAVASIRQGKDVRQIVIPTFAN